MRGETIHVRVQADVLEWLQARSLRELRSLSNTAAAVLTKAREQDGESDG
jgi:hypothetical protein